MFNLPVQANDILILASDGLSDNLWDEDVLDEVIRLMLIAHGAVNLGSYHPTQVNGGMANASTC